MQSHTTLAGTASACIMLTTQTALFSLICVGVGVHIYRPIHLIRVRGVTTTIYWTIRSWLFNHPITPKYSIWYEGDPWPEREKWLAERARVLGLWQFLRPFFFLHGYDLYAHIKQPSSNLLIPPENGVPPNKNATYPYARSLFESEEEAHFNFFSPKAWPARDKQGREVIIKPVSGASPSPELKAYRLLHSEPLRHDPRNHTMPIIEYLTFNQQTFIVMPRWSIARDGDFVKVGEILRYAHDFIEAIVFLHENKIAHGDLRDQNIYMDILVPWPPAIAGVNGPERKRALIDFETAVLPLDDGSCSPKFEETSKRDVDMLSRTLSVQIGCIEHIIPELGILLESMQSETRPTAAECLLKFEEIVKRLTPEDLELPVEASDCFQRGKPVLRKGLPIYRQLPYTK